MGNWRYCLLVWACSLCIIGFGCSWEPAIANMANPEHPGEYIGEPLGDVGLLDILHEDLRFDLRPLQEKEPAAIEVTYQIQNPEDDISVDLIFFAPGLETGSATLDGSQAIAAATTAAPLLPEAWQIPRSSLPVEGLQFTVPLSPGEHTLDIQYLAGPHSNDQSPYRIYTLDYLLAPASEWKSFGTLTVDVYTPRGWGTYFSLDLPAKGLEHWQAEFAGLPANILTLSTYPIVSSPISLARRMLILGSFALAITGDWWLCHGLGRLFRQQEQTGGWLVLVFLLMLPISIALVWGVIGVGGWLAELLLDDRHLAVSYAYARVWIWAFIGLVSGGLAPTVAVIGFVLGRRKPQPKRGHSTGKCNG